MSFKDFDPFTPAVISTAIQHPCPSSTLSSDDVIGALSSWDPHIPALDPVSTFHLKSSSSASSTFIWVHNIFNFRLLTITTFKFICSLLSWKVQDSVCLIHSSSTRTEQEKLTFEAVRHELLSAWETIWEVEIWGQSLSIRNLCSSITEFK